MFKKDGQWDSTCHGGAYCVTEFSNDGKLPPKRIATISHHKGYNSDDEGHIAQLFAAAPDLLSACEAFIAFEDHGLDDFGGYLAQANAVTEAIRAAVAKSKGAA